MKLWKLLIYFSIIVLPFVFAETNSCWNRPICTTFNTNIFSVNLTEGGNITGNFTIKGNTGWIVNDTVYSIWNGSCWDTRNGDTHHYVCA